MESLYAKSYLHFLKFSGFENYDNILEDFFKDNLQNEIYLELKNISDNSMETFKYFENYFKNNEMSFDEEKFETALMLGIKKEYAETDDITGFGSKCHDLWEELPEILSNKEPFLTLRYFDGYLDANEAKARKIMEKTLSDYNYNENYEFNYNYNENYKSKESIKAERMEYEVINNQKNIKKSLVSFVITEVLFIICLLCKYYDIICKLDILYFIPVFLFFGFLCVSITYIIKYFLIKKGKFVSGGIIFAALVLITTGIFEVLLYPEPENSWKDLNYFFMLLVLFFFAGPLLIADLLYYSIKMKMIKNESIKKEK